MTLETPEIVEIAADDLCRDLRTLGVAAGTALVVHASLRRIGRVAGGAEGVIRALMDMLTPEGALMMPAFSGQLSDPAESRNRPQTFDPVRTPSQDMGAIAETFRNCPGCIAATIRSSPWPPGAAMRRNWPRTMDLIGHSAQTRRSAGSASVAARCC